jgi:hypothetical protein
MELSGILGIAALANVIQALPVVESRSSIEVSYLAQQYFVIHF